MGENKLINFQRINYLYLVRKFPFQTLFHYLTAFFSGYVNVKILGEVTNFINKKDNSINISHIQNNFWEIVIRLIIAYGIVVFVHIAFEVYLVEIYSSHLRWKLAKKYLQANFVEIQREKFILSNYESSAIEVGTKAAQIFNRCFYSLTTIILLFWTLSKEGKWYLIPWILVSLVILSAISLLLFLIAYRYRLRRTKSIQKENKLFEEIKNNIEYIKIIGSEKQEIKKSNFFSSGDVFALSFSKALYATIPNYVMIKILPILFLILVAGQDGVFLGLLYWTLVKLFESWKKFFEELWAKGGYDSYYSNLNRLNKAFTILKKDRSSLTDHAKFSLTGKLSVSFQNVDFAYPESKQKILSDFTFTFQAGKKYAIIAPNGSGKSTLLKLIVKLYQPQKGNIKLNGNDLAKIDNSVLREKIIYLPNHPFFFNASLGNNIVYPEIYQENVYKKKLENIIEELGIEKFIDKLPNRWETVIAERGQNLSEGQKQLISLMRAFVKDYEIYLFDEFLSNISSEFKKKILEVVFRKLLDKTVVIIDHDPEVLSHLDEVYEFTSHKLIKSPKIWKN